jgi:Phage-integrase repeat unit
MFSRRTVALGGLNVGNVDADFITENPFGSFLQYTSDACGIKTFQELRTASRPHTFVSFEKARDFQEARRFVQSLKLKSHDDWREFCKSGEKPPDIPSSPETIYGDHGWRGLGDWLGTGTIAWANWNFRPFGEARDFARDLKLKSQDEWKTYCKSGAKPIDIPSNPHEAYKDDGWVNLGDWLGTGNRKFRSFYEARGFVRTLGIKSHPEWLKYCRSGKKPKDIPSSPHGVYRDDGWKNLQDWFGTRPDRKKFRYSFRYVYPYLLDNQGVMLNGLHFL